jgi:hypothetical protein
MWTSAFRRRRARAIDSGAALADFLDRQAALITQKSVIGYCHVKTRIPINELMREQRFADAYEVARWEAFAAILADLVVVIEDRLAGAAVPRRAELAGPLVALYARLLANHPAPAHRPAGWADAAAALAHRLAEPPAAPQPIAAIARTSGRRVFDTLPIHSTLRRYDEEPVIANVQFMMVGLASQIDARLDAAAVVGDLLAAPDRLPEPAPERAEPPARP